MDKEEPTWPKDWRLWALIAIVFAQAALILFWMLQASGHSNVTDITSLLEFDSSPLKDEICHLRLELAEKNSVIDHLRDTITELQRGN